jgi:hypothetical protein
MTTTMRTGNPTKGAVSNDAAATILVDSDLHATSTIKATAEDEAAEHDDSADIVAGRARRLDVGVATLAVTVAAMLATLALPWVRIDVAATTIELTTASGAVESIVTRAGSVRYIGRELGVAPGLVAMAIGSAVVAYAATRRWWYVATAVTVYLVRSGAHMPTVENFTSADGTMTFATAEIGLTAARWLYMVWLALMVAVSFQTYLVWKAQMNWARIGSRLAAAVKAFKR